MISRNTSRGCWEEERRRREEGRERWGGGGREEKFFRERGREGRGGIDGRRWERREVLGSGERDRIFESIEMEGTTRKRRESLRSRNFFRVMIQT